MHERANYVLIVHTPCPQNLNDKPHRATLQVVGQPYLHELVACVRAPTCVLSGADGQIRHHGAQGMFHADVRHLAELVVAVDGRRAGSRRQPCRRRRRGHVHRRRAVRRRPDRRPDRARRAVAAGDRRRLRRGDRDRQRQPSGHHRRRQRHRGGRSGVRGRGQRGKRHTARPDLGRRRALHRGAGRVSRRRRGDDRPRRRPCRDAVGTDGPVGHERLDHRHGRSRRCEPRVHRCGPSAAGRWR